MSFEDVLVNLAANAEKSALRVLAQHTQGLIDKATAAELLSVVVGTATGQGAAAGELAAVAWLDSVGLPPPKAARALTVDTDRLTEAATTILDGAKARREVRVARLASAEPVAAAQEALQETSRRGGAVGYIRQLNAGACELCQWLNKSDHVYPAGRPMSKHTGCKCTPRPVARRR